MPSLRPFPAGLGDLLDHIRRRRMVPGLRMEPEVIGVNSPAADKLPADAFMRRAGVRVANYGRSIAGHGLLLNNRAYPAWVDRMRCRHPRLMLENCASGGMRQDFATTSGFRDMDVFA
jgi:alpha-galactosidase